MVDQAAHWCMETTIDGRQVATQVSMGASFSTLGISLKKVGQLSIYAKYTGTPTGTWTIEVSLNRKEGMQGNFTDADGDWIPLIAAQFTGTLPVPAGAGATFLIIVPYSPFRRIRVTYTRGSGTGTADIWINGQG